MRIKTSARTAAVLALLKTQRGGYSNLVIDRAIEDAALSAQDASLAAAIFYGVLSRQITLDHILSRYSKKSVEKLDPPVRAILSAALYQLLFMDRVPEHAAVSEAVESAWALGKESAAAFINGVLRAFLRAGKAWELPRDREEALCVKYSLPKWLVRHFERDYGREIAGKYFESLLVPAPVYLRINTLKTNEEALIAALASEGVAAEKTALPNALRCDAQGDLTKTNAFSQGLFHIQDLSSQLACVILAPKAGSVVSDVCAAPGGKSFTLAETVGETGKVYSHDLYEQKIRLIESGAQRLGLLNLKASVRDAAAAQEGEMSDFLLCDAPCSGLGVLRRKPEIRYKDPIELRDLPALQLAILEHSAAFVKKGGVLQYSTCTISKRENGAVAAAFLQKHPEFAPLPIELPQGFTRAFEEPEHEFTTFPFSNGTDGFFIAKFRRI